MFIDLYIKEQKIKSYFLPDSYLENDPKKNRRQNHEARERLIKWHLEKIKNSHAKLMERHEVTFYLRFESNIHAIKDEEMRA